MIAMEDIFGLEDRQGAVRSNMDRTDYDQARRALQRPGLICRWGLALVYLAIGLGTMIPGSLQLNPELQLTGNIFVIVAMLMLMYALVCTRNGSRLWKTYWQQEGKNDSLEYAVYMDNGVLVVESEHSGKVLRCEPQTTIVLRKTKAYRLLVVGAERAVLQADEQLDEMLDNMLEGRDKRGKRIIVSPGKSEGGRKTRLAPWLRIAIAVVLIPMAVLAGTLIARATPSYWALPNVEGEVVSIQVVEGKRWEKGYTVLGELDVDCADQLCADIEEVPMHKKYNSIRYADGMGLIITYDSGYKIGISCGNGVYIVRGNGVFVQQNDKAFDAAKLTEVIQKYRATCEIDTE